MDYIPRYAQPFTLQEAIALEVGIITEEISRLQNSLNKLKETQTRLGEYIAEAKGTGDAVDPDILQAMEENVSVIGSQEERISILRMALSEKGIVTYGEHYDLLDTGQVSSQEGGNGDDAGVYL